MSADKLITKVKELQDRIAKAKTEQAVIKSKLETVESALLDEFECENIEQAVEMHKGFIALAEKLKRQIEKEEESLRIRIDEIEALLESI